MNGPVFRVFGALLAPFCIGIPSLALSQAVTGLAVEAGRVWPLGPRSAYHTPGEVLRVVLEPGARRQSVILRVEFARHTFGSRRQAFPSGYAIHPATEMDGLRIGLLMSIPKPLSGFGVHIGAGVEQLTQGPSEFCAPNCTRFQEDGETHLSLIAGATYRAQLRQWQLRIALDRWTLPSSYGFEGDNQTTKGFSLTAGVGYRFFRGSRR